MQSNPITYKSKQRLESNDINTYISLVLLLQISKLLTLQSDFFLHKPQRSHHNTNNQLSN